MTERAGASLDDEVERLREENRALDEQVKLLVQTEQRLYRTRSESDQQLRRIRSLAEFSLAYSGDDPPEAILCRSVGVLEGSFALEWAAALRIDPAGTTAEVVCSDPDRAGAPPAIALPPGTIDRLAALPAVAIATLPGESIDFGPAAILERCWPDDVAIPTADAPGDLLAMPLTAGRGRVTAMLLAYALSRPRAAYRSDTLARHNLPFLQLFANHLDRALENATLNEGLRERSAELVESNARLTESLVALERTQQQLLQARKLEAIGQLAGGIAHDFNNLLTVILGHASVLRDLLPAGAPLQKDAGRILEAGERAAAITGQLLAVGRRQVQRRAPLDLNRLAAEMSEMLERVIGEHIRLDLALDPGLRPVYADRAQIEQVLLNLVVNARDAMPRGGVLRIATRRASPRDLARVGHGAAAGFAVLEVSDTGDGMDDATKARIFEPFFTTKELGRGSGLGLSVVYGIVRQSDGQIFVESEPGHGARFHVVLPHAEGDPLGAAPEARVEPAATGATVLLVEDEPMVRHVAARFLAGAGYRVLEAVDGEDAIRVFESVGGKIDLLLADVVMPRLGGVGLAARLRESRPDLPVAFMSGYSSEIIEAERRGEPSDPFITKPFRRDALLTLVARAVR